MRAAGSIIVTDRGRPVLQPAPEIENPSTLERMISQGTARLPAESGIPDVSPELSDDVASLSDRLRSEFTDFITYDAAAATDLGLPVAAPLPASAQPVLG